MCPLVGSAGTIPLQHVPTGPASESHEVAFLATVGEPTVSEAVPKLVRVQLWDASRPAPTTDHLRDARLRQLLAATSEPEPIKRRERVHCPRLFVVA
jgi:hypothetical protein